MHNPDKIFRYYNVYINKLHKRSYKFLAAMILIKNNNNYDNN